MIEWLEKHMLPCPYKQLFGIDCPGCGFQRSCIALLQGHLRDSLMLYPATIPIFITAIFLIINSRFKFSNNKAIKNALFITVLTIIAVSYTIKMWKLYHHYTTSA
jgi:hypothetical protein